MYKHILLPTDGSELSEASIRAGIELARDQQAKVTGLYVMPDYRSVVYGADVLVPGNSDAFDESVKKNADKALGFIEAMAKQANVPYDSVRLTSNFPYQAIVKQAHESGCDLICMASHGRKGLSGVLLGSETQKVLAHTNIPVLVHRPAVSKT
ncbi:universal stress protein [Comamonas terrigena]|uniref:universal stress protein n=1 Tax=Comamonas terrigena TaxID=32013 RepID=UPI00244D2F11|nr:universal stress protein [Comamonas terrigena]MDH0051453.1 universal stress protein [Comamonas terrigena]MDH0513827.1 universal stress protein [Comamonas terrigena]MDH1093391.1 universal stress protein [Comamonas terrigena]MDH1503253.1 universal stress protein [Comamonas terrigena]